MATSKGARLDLPESSRALLARVEATGLSLQVIHDAAGLPSGWISKARRGDREPTAPGWAKLSDWLDRYEAKALPPGTAPPGPAAVAAAPSSPPAATVEAEGSLAAEIRAAKTARALGAVLSRVGALTASGALAPQLALALEKIVARRLVALKQARLERAERQLRSIEVLLPDEAELLRAYRERLAGPPLAPGVPVAGPPEPPPGALERLGIAPAAAPAGGA